MLASFVSLELAVQKYKMHRNNLVVFLFKERREWRHFLNGVSTLERPFDLNQSSTAAATASKNQI